MPAAKMTYNSLVEDVRSYAERRVDSAFADQVPQFIMLAEMRIATEVKGLGLKKFVTSVFVQNLAVVDKPVRWRETVSWNFGTGTGNNKRNTLFPRSYEYCRLYWPDPTVAGTPRYYADYDYDHFLVVATPQAGYPFELVYHERPLPLSAENQENWTTEHAPQLLLFATLLEAQPYLKLDERVAVWQAAYDRAAAGVSGEDKSRKSDHSTERKSA